jgi:predicted DNA-binding transcriptional regulator AlpA
MTNRSCNATAECIGCGDAATRQPAALLDVEAVAAMLGGCSVRHVYQLSDAGLMPRPIHLGRLVRWCRASLETWIVAGCPNCRKGGAR